MTNSATATLPTPMRIAARLGIIFSTALLTISCVPPSTQVSPQRIQDRIEWTRTRIVPENRVVILFYSLGGYKFTVNFTDGNNTTYATDDIYGPVQAVWFNPKPGQWVDAHMSTLPRNGWYQNDSGQCDLTLEVYLDGKLISKETKIGWDNTVFSSPKRAPAWGVNSAPTPPNDGKRSPFEN